MDDPLINLFNQIEDYFSRAISLKCLDMSDGAIAYMTGVSVENLNFVCIRKNTNAINKILDQSKQFYDTKNLPFTTIISEELCLDRMEEDLKSKGYLQTEQAVAMAIDLKTVKAHNKTEFDDETLPPISLNIRLNNGLRYTRRDYVILPQNAVPVIVCTHKL